MKKISYKEFIEIKKNYNGKPNCFNYWIKDNYNQLYNDIMSFGSFYTKTKANFSHKVIWYFLDIHEYPLCSVCGKINEMLPNIKLLEDYVNYPQIINLCKNHYYSSEYYQNKMKLIYITKFGVDNPNKLQSVKDKIQETIHNHYGKDGLSCKEIHDKKVLTCIKKYGTEYSAQSEQVKNKIQQTFDEKYDGHPLRDKNIQEKFKETCLAHYGVKHHMMSKEVKDKVYQNNINNHNGKYFTNPQKRKDTCLEKYGTENVSQNQEIKNKIHNSVKNKYGTDYIFQSELVKENIKKTNQRKYGVDNPSQNKEIHKKQVESIKNTKRNNSFELLVNSFKNLKLLSSKEEFFDYCDGKIHSLKWKCSKCSNEFEAKRDGNWNSEARCPFCYPINETKQQIDICTVLNENNISFEKYNREILDGKEIDIFVQDHNLALELDGLYWHSDRFQFNNDYHLNKTELCNKKGIQLIHIFEDEWNFKQDIVKSRIKNLLGIYDKTVYARKCEIKNITNEESKIFLEKNHIQGYCISKYRYGLFYNNELISLMTFGNYRKALGKDKIENEYELLRFCSKLGYHIPGAASKLLKHFETDLKPNKIISYADRRWSNGKLYESIGFKFAKNTEPNYWYIINNKREHRFKWRKSELPKLLNDVNMNESEVNIMKEHGFYRIFDCGNMLFEKTYF